MSNLRCRWCDKPYPCCVSVESAQKEIAALRAQVEELTRLRNDWKTEALELKGLAISPDGRLWRQRAGQAEAARKQPIKERILTADERAEYIAASERITAEDLLKRVG